MYWLIKRNSTVIDAVDEIHYVKYDTTKEMLIGCSETEAQGLSCIRTGLAYHLQGKPSMPAQYDTVTIEEVSYSVYKEEKDRLDAGQKTIAELNEKIAELQVQLNEQASRTTDCEDAILELGEIVGG